MANGSINEEENDVAKMANVKKKKANMAKREENIQWRRRRRESVKESNNNI